MFGDEEPFIAIFIPILVFQNVILVDILSKGKLHHALSLHLILFLSTGLPGLEVTLSLVVFALCGGIGPSSVALAGQGATDSLPVSSGRVNSVSRDYFVLVTAV